jgi:asparagine synthetase B (glutamine-hydrolysing)
MLLVALTRRSVVARLSHSCWREFPISPGWFLTCVTDNFLSRLSVSEDEIAVSESLLASQESREHDDVFVSARFLRNNDTLQISVCPVSARHVFYCQDGKGNFFVSTHISLLRQAGVPVEPDPEVLPEFLVYRVVAPPRTLFRNIRRVPAAGDIMVQLKGGNWEVSEQNFGYTPPLPTADSKPEAEMVAEVAGFLNTSVSRLRPVADRVATLLSGGVDSSIVSTIARDQLLAHDTYSTAFPFDGFETNAEQKYALSAASALSTRHTLFTATPADYLAGFIEALAVAEAPLDHLQSVLLHLLFKQAIPGRIDRLLSGVSADTAFGGASQFRWSQPPSLRRRFFSLPPAHLALRLLGQRWTKAQQLSASITEMQGLGLPITDPRSPAWGVGAYGDFEWVQAHYGASREDVTSFRRSLLRPYLDRPFDDVFVIYFLNFSGTGAEVWSKLAEGQRKILYCPFESKPVLDAAFAIPWETKFKSSKHIVRRVGKKLGVPEFALTRPKQSFGIVTNQWAEQGGPLEPLIAMAAKVVDIKQLRMLQGTAPNKAMTLWSLLNYAVLVRLFVMGESKESLLDELMRQGSKSSGRELAKASGSGY